MPKARMKLEATTFTTLLSAMLESHQCNRFISQAYRKQN